MCLFPRLVLNPKYLPNKKNGGNPPPLFDERIKYVPIGCQNCIECRKQKAREWKIRLTEEIRTHHNATFVTLTFNTESLQKLHKDVETNINTELKKCNSHKQYQTLNNKLTGYARDNTMATLAVRRFNERYRKKYKKALRHWLITELGTTRTEHIHLHGLIFTDKIKEIDTIWNYGFIWKGSYVNTKTINYIIKYVTKTDIKHPNYKPVILTSPGIGSQYTKDKRAYDNKFNDINTKEYYKTNTGHKIALPIYYRNKLYTDEEKEKLWINKLDENIRYVLGQKIDMNKEPERYTKLLEEAQKLNQRLGFGNDIKDWNKIQYENDQREIIRLKRIKNG